MRRSYGLYFNKEEREIERMKVEKKSRWKNLPFYERLSRRCKQRGLSKKMCEHIKLLDKAPKKMIYMAHNGKEVVFDAWEDDTAEWNIYWADICPRCYKKYRSILGDRAHRDGSGEARCYVCGCEATDADYYVDFKPEEVRFK